MSRSEDIKPGTVFGWKFLRDLGIGDRPRVTAGTGLSHASTGHDIALKADPPARGARRVIDAQITGNAQIGANKWQYTWTEVGLFVAGEWASKDPGRSSDAMGVALNKYEIPNGPTGVQGNGVDVGNLIGTFAIQPIATGIVTRLELVSLTDGSSTQAWISEPNGVDGTCPAASPGAAQIDKFLLEQHPPP